MRIVLGFDPGGRETGVVLRHRDTLLAGDVVVRHDDLTMPDGTYTRDVTGTAVRMLERHGFGPRSDELIVVSEGVRYWPKKGKGAAPNLTGLLGAAIVHGAICERWPSTIVVPPGVGHGSFHESSYPAEIRPARHGKGKDRNRHARSAWDASHHGETLHLQRIREGQR